MSADQVEKGVYTVLGGRQAGQASWAVRARERVVRLDAAIFTQLMLQ